MTDNKDKKWLKNILADANESLSSSEKNLERLEKLKELANKKGEILDLTLKVQSFVTDDISKKISEDEKRILGKAVLEMTFDFNVNKIESPEKRKQSIIEEFQSQKNYLSTVSDIVLKYTEGETHSKAKDALIELGDKMAIYFKVLIPDHFDLMKDSPTNQR